VKQSNYFGILVDVDINLINQDVKKTKKIASICTYVLITVCIGRTLCIIYLFEEVMLKTDDNSDTISGVCLTSGRTSV